MEWLGTQRYDMGDHYPAHRHRIGHHGQLPYRDSIYPLVFVWAYVAIAVEHPNNENVRLAALILAAIILVYALWLFFARNRERD